MLTMTHKCVIVQVGEPNKKKIGKLIHILVAEVAVVSLQLLLTAVTFTKCYHTFPAVNVLNSGVTYSLSRAAQLNAL
jgi:hypothetical protein